MKSFPPSLNSSSNKVGTDPFTRLSLAVRELDKLISRANQLAHFSEQPFPHDQPVQSNPDIPPQIVFEDRS